jgi:hypothetical protein
MMRAHARAYWRSFGCGQECGTELVITRITPVFFIGEFEYLTLACETCSFTKEIKIKRS